jgi:hypothetical protein
MSKPLDFTDREIKVGDTCVYPVRRGSSMWLQKMTVSQIEFETRPGAAAPSYKLRGYNNVGRKVTVTSLKNTIVIDQPLAS